MKIETYLPVAHNLQAPIFKPDKEVFAAFGKDWGNYTNHIAPLVTKVVEEFFQKHGLVEAIKYQNYYIRKSDPNVGEIQVEIEMSFASLEKLRETLLEYATAIDDDLHRKFRPRDGFIPYYPKSLFEFAVLTDAFTNFSKELPHGNSTLAILLSSCAEALEFDTVDIINSLTI